MEIIPGLPNDVGLECLIRIPFDQFSTVESVCKVWKAEIEQPKFRQLRKSAGVTRPIIVVAQARVNPTQIANLATLSRIPVYRLVLCEPETGYWSDLPPLLEFSDGLPMFCQLIGVGLDLVVMGGYDPVSWEVLNSVFIYNFVSSTWRRGVDMPGGPRSFFGSTSDSDRRVFIAGGHDDEKNALRSTMVYDVTKNEWISLPDMTRERDECNVIFHAGKLHVIGGYPTKMQGHFEKSVETFDIDTWQWGPIVDAMQETATCPKTRVAGGDEKLYMCREGYLLALENANWQVVAKLPNELSNLAYLTTWQGKLLAIGSTKLGEPHTAYFMELKNYRWTKLMAPAKYSGHVQSGCCLEI